MRLHKHSRTTCSHEGGSSPGRWENLCGRLADAAYRRFGPGASWAQRHIATCPRCQQRLAGLGRVDLALSVIKSQPHRLDLLMRANEAAIHMLSNRLRQTAEADQLKHAKPEPLRLERLVVPQNVLVNMAACIAVLALTKTGVFSSLDKAHTRGQAAMRQYYVDRAGEDLADEIFKT